LDHTQRFENLKGAFQAEPVLVKGKSILLIDDVMTTGATFNECAKTLKQAGAKKVYCLSVATTRPI
jgi:predicted amidophosphoribosyltransferase